jgi:tripeptide aminopeptidase
MSVDTQPATDRLMRFLGVEGVTGKEAAIGRELSAALEESGVPADTIRLDDANTRIPVLTETGNLILDLPGRGAMHDQPRIMFMTHMDTVPLWAGAKPKLASRRSRRRTPATLGTSDRGCREIGRIPRQVGRAPEQCPCPPVQTYHGSQRPRFSLTARS